MSDTDAYDDEYDETTDYDRNVATNPTERGKWVSVLIALLGAWLIVEALVFDILMANFWNDVIVGIALLAIGGYNYYRRADERVASFSAAVFAALLGLWLIVSPFVYAAETEFGQVTTEIGFWNDVIVGLLVLVLGAYSAYEARDTDVVRPAEQ